MQSMKAALTAAKAKFGSNESAEAKMSAVLCDAEVMSALVSISRLPVFSKEFGLAFKDDLDLLHALKQIKYFWNLQLQWRCIYGGNGQFERPSSVADLDTA